MAEMVDATDLKSVDHYDRPGSTPGGTTSMSLQTVFNVQILILMQNLFVGGQTKGFMDV